jgi:fructokinase
MNPPRTILCFGEALWDVRGDGRTPGGAPMNVALRLASLGGTVRLATRVGRDEAGDSLLAYLRQAGLDTRAVQRDPQHPTGRVLVDLTNPLEARYKIEQPAAWDFIATDEAPQVPGSDLAVVYGSLAARSVTSRQTLLGLLDAAPLRVFDVNLRPPHVERSVIESLLQRANWAKLNQDELDVIAGWHGWAGNLDALLHQLAAHYRLDCVCVTLGAHGAAMLRDGRLHRQAGFRVPVLDTIGCGDSFLASWLLDLLQGSDPERALRRACALGALVAAEAGANPAVDAARVDALAGP